jgi:hypothetical protein
MTKAPQWVTGTMLQKAYELAAEEHSGGSRKGKTEPYIHHLERVGGLIRDFGGTEDQMCAGLLHDIVEDTSINSDIIAREVSVEVARIVLVCSDTEPGEDRNHKPEWRFRKERYHAKLAGEPLNDPALLVSLCDKIDNAEDSARDLEALGPEKFWEPFNAGDSCQQWNYESLYSIYLARMTGPTVVEPLARLRTALDALFGGREILPCRSTTHVHSTRKGTP